jgi:PAS domain S-box-containing protein
MTARTDKEGSRESVALAAPQLLDRLPVSVVAIDREGRLRYCNQSFVEATGYTASALEGRYLWEFLTGEKLLEARRHVAAGAPKPQLSWKLLIEHSAGGCRLAAWSFRPIDGAEEAAGLELIGTGLPVSESRSGAGASSEDQILRAMITHSSDVLCVLAPDGTLRFVSPSAERLLGHRPDRLIGAQVFNLVHPDDLEAARAAIERGLASPGRPEILEIRVRRSDGQWATMEVRGVAHADGETTHLLLNLSDVSARARAEAALAASEERFRSAFENTAIGKVLWDANGRVLRANRAVLNMLAYSEAELLHMSWREMCQADDQAALLPALRRLLAGELPSAQAALRVRHREGHWTWVRATLSPLRSDDGNIRHVIGELEDITEQRAAEIDRRDQIDRQQRHQAAIVRMATHEAVANGPLAAALQAITEIAADATHTARVGVWFLEEDGDLLRCAELFDTTSGRHETGAALAAAAYPAYFRALEADRVVDACDARTDPRTREFLEDYLMPLGITSMLDAPIRIRGRVAGVVCLEHVGEPRVWHSAEVAFAGEVADHVSQAVSNAQRAITESRLQISEERFRSVVNAIPMGVLMYRLSDDGRLIFSGANPAADRILRVDCHRYLGKTIEEAFPPLALTEIPDRYRAAAADGTPWHTQQVLYHDDLIRGAYEVHAFQTTPGTVAVVFTDITSRKQADEALRASEARYRSLFEHNLAGVYRSTLDGKITNCNDAFARIFGYSSAAEAMERSAIDFYSDPADRRRLVEEIERVGEIRNHELRMRRADGTTLWVLANMHLDRDPDGRPTAFEGTMIDISELKRTTSRMLLQSTALESAANAVAVTDPSGTIEWVNYAFSELTGYDADEAVGENLWLLKSGNGDSRLRDDITAMLAGGMVWRGELVNRRKDGRLYTEELTVTPVRGPAGEIHQLIAVQQDVSERKRIEEQLLQAQKMEAVGRLAGGVAHDFNNLLQAMLGVIELVRKRLPADSESSSRLLELDEYVRRGSQLTRQLLLFSRRDAARDEALDLNDTVHGTVRLLHRLLRENVELVFAPTDIDLPLVADRGQIEQVVMNLAVNACDAMPRGGRLFLRTGRESDQAWLEVADSGEGIPDEIRDQLFEPFFTTKEPGKGSGLGLAVVHTIVTRLGGTIDVESRVGEGTTVRVSLPLVENRSATAPRQPALQPAPQQGELRGCRLLVVEDDPAVRSSLRELLRLLGYDVVTVGSREESIYLPPSPAFDLLLTDYMLPDAAGTDIARELRQRWPQLKVVVMSGYAQDGPLGPDARLEGMAFLQKPFGTEALAETVRAALAGPLPEPDGSGAADGGARPTA